MCGIIENTGESLVAGVTGWEWKHPSHYCNFSPVSGTSLYVSYIGNAGRNAASSNCDSFALIFLLLQVMNESNVVLHNARVQPFVDWPGNLSQRIPLFPPRNGVQVADKVLRNALLECALLITWQRQRCCNLTQSSVFPVS